MGLLTIVFDRTLSRARSAFRYSAGLAALCTIATGGLATGAENEPLEFAVKAAYLSKFGLYVEWPNTVFSSASSAFNLCVIGEDPFGAVLDKAAANQRIGNRAIVIRRLKTVERDSGCHILYISSADRRFIRQVIETVHGGNVLVVSDAASQAAAGSSINFVIKDNRVRFDIDEEAAVKNGLTISSKLLGLALNVKRKQEAR
jgi:YfiR/HmsC-like